MPGGHPDRERSEPDLEAGCAAGRRGGWGCSCGMVPGGLGASICPPLHGQTHGANTIKAEIVNERGTSKRTVRSNRGRGRQPGRMRHDKPVAGLGAAWRGSCRGPGGAEPWRARKGGSGTGEALRAGAARAGRRSLQSGGRCRWLAVEMMRAVGVRGVRGSSAVGYGRRAVGMRRRWVAWDMTAEAGDLVAGCWRGPCLRAGGAWRPYGQRRNAAKRGTSVAACCGER